MSSLKLNGSTSGYVEIVPPAVAGNNSVTLPSGSGTLVTGDSGGNLNVSGIVTATSFVIGAGSTASPSLSPTGDSNTGIFFPAADTIAFGEGGAEVARFDSSSRLLVGTTASQAVGTAAQANFQVAGTSVGGDYHISAYQFNNNTDGGYLVLGSSRGTSVGSYTVVQNGDNLGRIIFAGADGTNFQSRGAWISCDVDGTPGSGDMPGRLIFSTTADGASSPTERVRILSGGGFRATTTGSYENTSAAHHEFVTTGNNNIMNIYHTDSNGGNCGGLYLKFTNAAPNGTGLAFRFDDNAAMRFIVRTNGGIANYQSNDSNLCDEREKKNIEALDSTWNCLKEWELKKFHYNEDDDADNKRYGVIAQQVANHCPEVISEWIKQEAQEAKLDEEGNEIEPAKEEIVRMGVKEQQMMWMAIKALQEAQTRIETLEAEVAALKNS